MNDAIKTKVTAPKLTEAQRESLRRIYVVGDAPAETLASFMSRGWICRGGIHKYELTDAGRAALRGES